MAKNKKRTTIEKIRRLNTTQLVALFIIFIMVVSSVSAFVLYLV